MPIFHVTTQLGRMDSFFLEADNENDIVSLLDNVSEADIINIKKLFILKIIKLLQMILFQLFLIMKILYINGLGYVLVIVTLNRLIYIMLSRQLLEKI